MISTPYRFLKSKKLSSQKETFIKNIQVFSENLIKKKKKFEENASKEHSQFNPAMKENKELIQKKVLNFISKLSLKERMKLFTISNKWLVEVLIQLFSLYENNNKITFELSDEMAAFIGKENKCWKCGHEFHENEYNLNSYYSTESLDSKYIPSFDECSQQNDYFNENESIETDAFSYKLYFKISDSIEEKEDKNRLKMESDFLKYIKIVKPYNIITLDKELLLDFEKLKKFFEYFTKSNCFKDWIMPIENEQGKNFNLPEWLHKINSLTFFQILITFFEQHILLNYEYFFYTDRIYQTKYQENLEELYDEINSKVKQLNSETFQIDKIFSETIIKTQINEMELNNNNDELSTKIYNELKNKIKDYNDQKEKVIKLLEILTFLDLDEVANKRQPIYKYYKEYIFKTLENEIAEELIDDSNPEKKEKKHKKNKKAKNKNINKVKDDKREIKEDKKEENKETEKENQNAIKEEKDNTDIKAENENKICKKEKKEKHKEFFLFTNFNKSKKNKPEVAKGKETNFIENNKADSNDKLIRIISKTSLSTYKSSNDQEDIEDISSIISDMSDNVIQESNTKLESSVPKLNIQNSTNNAIQNHYINNSNNNYYNNFQFCYNIPRNIYNNWYNKFYDEGIAAYCAITQNNVLILNNLKEKYFKIIIEDIIKKNLKAKYNLKFKFYGSTCTNLSIEGSDSDCCIFFKELIQNNLPFHEELYFLLKENQHKREDVSYEIIPIFSTKIPRIIVKIDIRKDLQKCPLNNFYQYLSDDDMDNIKIDFTFTKDEEHLMNLDKNVQYVKHKLEIFPQLRPVFLILKRYFKNMGMNEVYKGGISTYSLFLLTLNSIYNYQKENPNFKIPNIQLLIQVFKKFSNFKFEEYGIGIDNNEYNLGHKNESEILYILDPLTGKNIASVGKCTGKEVKATFTMGYNLLCFQNNYFIQLFQNNRLLLMNSNPIISIVSLFNK